MSQKGNARKLRNGLTQKENAFKNKVVEQISKGEQVNGTQAALEVFDTTDPAVAGQIAYEKLKKPEIKEQITLALEDQGLTPSKLLSNIGRLANFEPSKVTADVILRSNQDLLKIMGAYPDKRSAHVSLTLKGKVSEMGFEELKVVHSQLNEKVGQLIQDSE